MAGFGRRQRQAYGFDITHFTHQDDIRIFTQGCPQCLVEAVCIAMDFTLINDAFLAAVNKLDWIFDRQNVSFNMVINMINHGRQRGRFTRREP